MELGRVTKECGFSDERTAGKKWRLLLSLINVLIELKATVLFENALFIIDQLSLDIVTLHGILLGACLNHPPPTSIHSKFLTDDVITGCYNP